jgi:hypothetical protein
VSSAEVRAFCVPLRLLAGARILILPGRGEDYNRVHVAAATLGGLGPWVLYLLPTHPPAISRVMEAIKDGATKRINRTGQEAGILWQPRFPSTRLGQALIVRCVQ